MLDGMLFKKKRVRFVFEGKENEVMFALDNVCELAISWQVFPRKNVEFYAEVRFAERLEGECDLLYSIVNKIQGCCEVVVYVETDFPNPIEFPGVWFQPYFPRSLSDIDASSNRILRHGQAFVGQNDHPMYTDEVYKRRVEYIKDLAMSKSVLESPPEFLYSEAENKTWTDVWDRLQELHVRFACSVYLKGKHLLQMNGLLCREKIPSLKAVSDFLLKISGFRIKAVPGMLSSRDFLNGLAFRVFHATQYIRHEMHPFYSPEPDICHEVIGHIPMLLDRSFAKFSQQIGIASLGASDAMIEELSNFYWFSLEWGVIQEGGLPKAYGAGLLAAAGELLSFGEGKVALFRWCLEEAMILPERTVTKIQTKLLVCENFLQIHHSLKRFLSLREKPFVAHVDPFSMAVLTSAADAGQFLMLSDASDSIDTLRLAMFNQ